MRAGRFTDALLAMLVMAWLFKFKMARAVKFTNVLLVILVMAWLFKFQVVRTGDICLGC